MSSVALGLAIDIFLMISLGITIYYAMRLSRSLNSFRTYKEELQGLIFELSSHIDHAQDAMKNLKIDSAETADHLSELIKESRGLSEELQIINQVSDSLAGRLEALAGARNKDDNKDDNKEEATSAFPDQPAAPPRDVSAGPSDVPSFFIQDREIQDREFEEESVEDVSEGAGDDDIDVPENLQSEAERELFRALNKRKANG